MGDGIAKIEHARPNPGEADVSRDYIGGGAGTYQSSLSAGEQGINSPTLSRSITTNLCKSTTLLSVATVQDIGGATAVPIRVKAIIALRPMTGTVTIAGFSKPDNVAALTNTVVVPIPVGPINGAYPLMAGAGFDFHEGLQITCSVAADGPFVLVGWEEGL